MTRPVRTTSVRTMVERAVRQNPGCTFEDIQNETGLVPKTIADGVIALVDDGVIYCRNGARYYPTHPRATPRGQSA